MWRPRSSLPLARSHSPAVWSPLPLPVSTLIDHLKTRKRVVIVEESQHHYGVAAEIAACLLESGYRGKVLRIGAPPIPIASARSLERQILPDETRIFEQVLDMI